MKNYWFLLGVHFYDNEADLRRERYGAKAAVIIKVDMKKLSSSGYRLYRTSKHDIIASSDSNIKTDLFEGVIVHGRAELCPNPRRDVDQKMSKEKLATTKFSAKLSNSLF